MRNDAAREAVGRLARATPPASGAVVMGTGIVSIGLSLDGRETSSRAILVIAAIVWVTLGLLLAGRMRFDREGVRSEARLPASLTGVAGTAVLGTRLTLLGWTAVGWALLAIALVVWLVLLPVVLRSWHTPTVGASLVLAVSTESLAVLAATLAAQQHTDWLLYAAFAPFLLGVAFYVFVISRFDLSQLLVGHGDHWITGGALAISALSAGRITLSAEALHTLTGAIATFKVVSLVVWGLALAWLPVLLAVEAWRPRLAYDVRRWSTVFPVGMYAACSFSVGAATKTAPITDFARVWVWVGVAVWLVVFIAMLRRGVELTRDLHPLASPQRGP